MGAPESHLPVVMCGQKNVSMAAFGRECEFAAKPVTSHPQNPTF